MEYTEKDLVKIAKRENNTKRDKIQKVVDWFAAVREQLRLL